MTKIDYLTARVNELSKNVHSPFISEKQRKNEMRALRFYQNDLEREKSLGSVLSFNINC